MRTCILGSFRLAVVIAAVWSLACIQPRAQEKDATALAAGMKDVLATMEQGLTSASKSGRPISAKFEMDDGEVAFSIYVERSDGFREIVINPQSGNAAGATILTEADDLKSAQAQAAAMATATMTLLVATQNAVAKNPGARVVSVYPELQNGQAIAAVTLLRGENFSKVSEKLD
jgi:hypothetical protein